MPPFLSHSSPIRGLKRYMKAVTIKRSADARPIRLKSQSIFENHNHCFRCQNAE